MSPNLARELNGGLLVAMEQFGTRRLWFSKRELTHVARDYFGHHLDFASHRRPPHLALQRRLGLLPLRRAGPRAGDHHHPAPAWTNITPGQTPVARSPSRDGERLARWR